MQGEAGKAGVGGVGRPAGALTRAIGPSPAIPTDTSSWAFPSAAVTFSPHEQQRGRRLFFYIYHLYWWEFNAQQAQAGRVRPPPFLTT